MTISPDQVVAPSPEIAERTLEVLDDLTRTLSADGPGHLEVEAMAMHNASLSALRGAFGPPFVRRMLKIAERENERVADRDRAVTSDRRSVEARMRTL